MINKTLLLRYSFFLVFLFCRCLAVNAGLNNFTDLIFVEDWLIERKIDLTINEIQCRASIPSHATWFGARVRIGPNNELIIPILSSVEENQLIDSKLAKVKEVLAECRAGFLFLPDSL